MFPPWFRESWPLPLAQVSIAIAPGFGSRRPGPLQVGAYFKSSKRPSARADAELRLGSPSPSGSAQMQPSRSISLRVMPFGRQRLDPLAEASSCCCGMLRRPLSSANRRSQSLFPKTVTTMSKGANPNREITWSYGLVGHARKKWLTDSCGRTVTLVRYAQKEKWLPSSLGRQPICFTRGNLEDGRL